MKLTHPPHPQVHIVHFDSNQKIQQVRLYWDQGSLLKLVDVIGSRARNWPIRDGKDQARLIASSAAGTSQSNGPPKPAAENAPHDPNEVVITNKPRAQSQNVTRDLHASLALFAHREEEEDSSAPALVAPRASAKPPPRDYHDLFVGNGSDASPKAGARATSPQKENGGTRASKAQSAKPPPRDYHDLFVGNESDASPVSRNKMASPQKENMTPGPAPPKAGAGKNFQPSRLFETDRSQPGTPGTPTESSDIFRKPDPKKYNHFEFGDGNENQLPTPARPKTKHQSQWDFEDFITPAKVSTKVRGQDVRHFGWSDDEPVMDSPAKHPAVAKARPDANPHFEFGDDGTPGGNRRPAGHARGQGNMKGLGLYQNNVFDESDQPLSSDKKGQPLATVTNLRDRRKDLDPHFSMTDDSPSQGQGNNKPISEARAKVVSQMGAQWEATDQSPGAQHPSKNEDRINPISGDKENILNGGSKKHVGIKSGGDGMGGKKGSGRIWGFGDESDEDGVGGANGGKFQAGKKQQAPKDSGFWDF